MAAPGFKLTPEFEASVSSSNLLRTRIMLKDSMVIDPTGKQFDDMLDYAKRKLPGIIVSYDGEPLEADPSKWDRELMNRELILLVNNFSNERISHLWRVIRKIRENDIRRLESQEKVQPFKEAHSLSSGVSTRTSSNPLPKTAVPSGLSVSEKKQNRAYALGDIQAAGEAIERIMRDTAQQGKKWRPTQVSQMKQAAQRILAAAERYEKNR